MKKNIAIVGYGGQGGWHADHALKSDVVTLAGVYDIDEKKYEKARAKGIKTYDSFEAVLNDESVDVVVCATPNDVHEEIVVAALNAGKNVVCEKPVEMSVASLDRMIAAANKSGKLFTVHQNRRWDVDFLGIKSIIESGKIGEVVNIESRIHGSRGIPSDWRCHKPYGGGMILDWGVHLIDQMMFLITSEIDTVACTCTNITTDEVDDGFKLSIKFVDGKTAYIEVGTFNFIALPRFYMQCKNGTAIVTDWRENAKVVRCKAWHESDVVPVQTAAGITKTMAPRDEITTETYEVERPESDVHDFYRNLCKAIDGTEPQLVTHAQVRRVMKIMEAAFKSNDLGGTPVKFDEQA
jgi:predicted dehydrogenase